MAELVLVLVKLGAARVAFLSLFLHLVLHFKQRVVLLGGLVAQDLNFVLQDLNALLHLGQVLRGVLDLANVLVPCVPHFLVQGDERLQSEISFLRLLSQIQN